MQKRRTMEKRRIDCPDTEKREEIELERTPFGVVIASCSRFAPTCAVTCGGHCARLLDRRDRRDVDDGEPRVLVAYAGGDRALAATAAGLAVHLSGEQLTVELADLQTGSAPPPSDYDVVVIGSFAERGRLPRSVLDFIADHRDTLATMPAYAFVMGTDRDLLSLREISGWTPAGSVAFAASPSADRSAHVRELALHISESIPEPELLVTMAPARKRIATVRDS
jgi:hypothetical protein